ncbi:MAG: hypothetical protein JXR05_00945 [Flavobacteriaceae bacterium]
MKKTFLLLSFCSLFFFGCLSSQELSAFQKIDYKAQTRGSSFQITLQKGTLTYIENNKEVFQRALSKKESKAIYKSLKGIDLNTIDKITPPSKNHQSDRSLIASLEVESEGTIYKSSSFDDDNPPKELKELVDYLKSLTQ